MTKTTGKFLKKHKFNPHLDINSVAKGILKDMSNGLQKKIAGQDMILTYSNPPEGRTVSQSIIVIDAGGTNFRSCLVTFDAEGKAVISDLEKTKMPGIERELSKKEFFDQFAVNLEHLKDKADKIGFCFSYPTTILEDGDGVLIAFSKEVKAPEVVGCRIGTELCAALKEHGWQNEMKAVILNDTVSALLAGAADIPSGKKYSSYIGFILGTGMNAAYIQPGDEYEGVKKQIINCESGRYANAPVSDFDLIVDAKSVKPGVGLMEKKCSGVYLGPVSLEIIQSAARERLFSAGTADSILRLNELTPMAIGEFMSAPHNAETLLGKIVAGEEKNADRDQLYELLDAAVERTARLAAAIITACVVKSKGGKSPSNPVCVLCNGSTFYKAWKVKERVTGYLEETLVKEKGLYFELVSKEDDITLGTAIGGLSH